MDSERPAPRFEGRAARISDVATAAEVSTATVSRALAFPERVSEKTRRRVLEAVRDLNYTPNEAARSLRVGATRMILVVTPYLYSGAFFHGVINGLDAEFASAGYTMIVGSVDGPIEKARRLVDLVYSRQVDGVVVLSGVEPIVEGRSLLDAEAPVVSICSPMSRKSVPSVLIDDEECARKQFRHLFDLQHRRFAYVAGEQAHYSEITRYRGVRKEAEASGLGDADVVRLNGAYTLESGAEAGRRYLELADRPTGVVCASDEMAIGFIKTVSEAGLSVPRDLSVVGFDGIPFALYYEPSLTTIVQPQATLGGRGAEALLKLIRDPRAHRTRRIGLKGELRIGGSTGPAPSSAVHRKRPAPLK